MKVVLHFKVINYNYYLGARWLLRFELIPSKRVCRVKPVSTCLQKYHKLYINTTLQCLVADQGCWVLLLLLFVFCLFVCLCFSGLFCRGAQNRAGSILTL